MAWIPPDDVLPRALRTIEGHASGSGKICVIRDGKGRIRVALEAKGAVTSVGRLTKALSTAIGHWFAAPIVVGDGSPAHRRIAAELLRNAIAWPADWPNEIERSVDGTRIQRPNWLLGSVVLQSKESWLAMQDPRPPPPPPRVVSFYSFKGGVGRTTTLSCVAANLALRHIKVVAIDLDLEAPGLGNFLGARASTGVIDHILSHVATGDVGDVVPDPVEGIENLFVLPAGTLGPGYLEKLARLDFLAGAEQAHASSPAEAALRALLQAVKDRVNPTVILLDNRAGLHDLGGLALHRLSHTDILLARANAQAKEGLGLVLATIRRIRRPEDRDVRIVQTMVPLPFDSEPANGAIAQWRTQMYDLCAKTIYEDLDDADTPQPEDQAAHYPLLVGYRDELTRTDRISQIGRELLPGFDEIANVVVPATEDAE